MRYGCNGIDLNLGAFSIANKDEIIQQMRSLASGAATYAFGAAIDAMCSNCWTQMREWANQINKASSFLKQSCEQNSAAIAGLVDQGVSALKNSKIWQGDTDSALNTGTSDDAAAARDKSAIMTEEEACGDKCVYNVLFALIKESEYFSGNRTLDTTLSDGISLTEMLMSVSGTYISNNRNSTATDDWDAEIAYKRPLLDTYAFFDGYTQDDPTNSPKMYKCDDVTECLNPTEEEQNDWTGLTSEILTKLQTIAAKKRSGVGSSLTEEEVVYANMIPGGERHLAYIAQDIQSQTEILNAVAQSTAIQVVKRLFADYRVVLNNITKVSTEKPIPQPKVDLLLHNLNLREQELQEIEVSVKEQLEKMNSMLETFGKFISLYNRG